jgi:hypothetical protein
MIADQVLVAEDAPQDLGLAEVQTPECLEKKLHLAWKLFESVENQVQVADRKVQAILPQILCSSPLSHFKVKGCLRVSMEASSDWLPL